MLQTKEIYAIINNNNAGGSFKWQTDIAKHIPIYQITNYNSLLLFLKTNSNKEITITINSFLATDFTVRHILDLYSQYKFDIILPFHDWYWFDLSHVYNNNIHNVYLNKKLVITDEVAQLFRISKILCATYFIKDILERVIDTSNITVVPWIDYKIENYTNTKLVNIEESKTIVIGVLTETSEYKGQEQVDYLAKRFKYFKNKYNVKIVRVGVNIRKYNDNIEDFMKIIDENNIIGLLMLNKWGETWCYSLTKHLMSGLPIFYNNIGAFKERIPKNNPRYFINNNDEGEFYRFSSLNSKFTGFLEYLVKTSITVNIMPDKCNTTTELIPIFKSKIEKKTKKFAVYFPQFHKIRENDITFYDGYSDIINLKHLEVDNKETPNYNMLGLRKIEDYNLEKNDKLIKQQIKLLNDYNIDGFAMYFYWFSKNTITNEKTIMYNIIEKMLDSQLNTKKIFFIWANEDWSGNPAFGRSNNIIENTYDTHNIKLICAHLITAFRKETYLKLDNKPVFYIHHPWLMPAKLFRIHIFSNSVLKVSI